MTEYNSEQVMSAVMSSMGGEYPKERDNISRITIAVDEYAQTHVGQYATQNLLLCGGEGEQETFRDGAKGFVRSQLYGSGILSVITWMAVKWLVMAIIERYIEQLIKQEN